MLEIQDHGEVREIRIARPPANALNPELVEAMIAALEEAPEHAGALVVSGLPGMFSAGLDVPHLMTLGRPEMTAFWQRFTDLLKTIATMPVPTAFAMTGHAPAGGIVMALFGDYRIMPRGGYKTGLNEVQVGLVVPRPIQRALARAVGPHTAERILVAGEMMPSERAYDIGLIDELAEDPVATVAGAIGWCRRHLELPRHAMLKTRELVRADLHRVFEADSEQDVDGFVDIWFADSTRAALKALLQRLSG
jgi:enoyl-CoA hydratase/carnithine racemase